MEIQNNIVIFAVMKRYLSLISIVLLSGCSAKRPFQAMDDLLAGHKDKAEKSYMIGAERFEQNQYNAALSPLLGALSAEDSRLFIYQDAEDSALIASTCFMLSHIYNSNGLPHHARWYSGRGKEHCHEGDSVYALLEKERVSAAESISSDTLSHAAIFSWNDHKILAANSIGSNLQKRIYRLWTFRFISLLAIIVLTVTLFSKRRKYKKEKEIAYLGAACETLRSSVDSLKRDNDSHQAQITALEEATHRNEYLQRLFINLYKKEFHEIGDLCHVFMTDQSREKEENVYREVQKIVGKIQRTQNNNSAFEKMLNERLDHVMSKIRQDFPGQDESEYQFIGYCIAGFSASFIAVLIPGLYVPSVYVKRGRIIKKLTSCDSPHAELYRSLLQ